PNELVATSYTDDRNRIHWKDKEWEKDYNFLKSKLPDKEITPTSSTSDERVWMIVANSDREQGERYLFNRNTKQLTFQYRPFEKLQRDALAETEPVRYPSSDGLTIPTH